MSLFHQFAYIDTGTGSLIIQSLIGVVAGIGVFGRRFFGNIVHKIRGQAGSKDRSPKT